ncbi:MAG: HepT-like ribonuclease domain-containing protein [Myxococcota bacterium]
MGDDATYLLHIRDACERIESYTTGGRDVFLTDRKTQDAVIRNIEIIGEATKNLSTRFRHAHPDVPWRRMAGMRDRVIHGYFGVDLELVWEVVERHLPPLKDRIDRLLGP